VVVGSEGCCPLETFGPPKCMYTKYQLERPSAKIASTPTSVFVFISAKAQAPNNSTHVMQEDRTFVGQVNDLEEVLHSEGAIEARIRQVAGQIDKDYEGKTVVLIGILKGSGYDE